MNLARLISTVHNQKNSYMNGYLKALGLSHGQAITLKIIHEENCIKQDDLNKRLQIDKSAVTRILKTLEEKGLIVKTRCEDDKRNQHNNSYTDILHDNSYCFKIFSTTCSIFIPLEPFTKIISPFSMNRSLS